MEKGLIHIYCGDGKGKTTCGMGLCLRSAGAGLRVLIYQFMKDGRGNERGVLEKDPHVHFAGGGRKVSFSFRMSEEEKSRERDRYEAELAEVFSCARQELFDVLFLDEVLYAVSAGLYPEEELLDFLDTKPEGLEVILTGRDPSDEVKARADYISRIVKEKHPYDSGLPARRGIEY